MTSALNLPVNLIRRRPIYVTTTRSCKVLAISDAVTVACRGVCTTPAAVRTGVEGVFNLHSRLLRRCSGGSRAAGGRRGRHDASSSAHRRANHLLIPTVATDDYSSSYDAAPWPGRSNVSWSQGGGGGVESRKERRIAHLVARSDGIRDANGGHLRARCLHLLLLLLLLLRRQVQSSSSGGRLCGLSYLAPGKMVRQHWV